MLQVSPHAALARLLVDLLCPLDGDLARLFVDMFTVRELFLDDVDLRDVLAAARAIRRS